MRKTYTYILTAADGKEIARGRRRDVLAVLHCRYTYEGIYDDVLTRE